MAYTKIRMQILPKSQKIEVANTQSPVCLKSLFPEHYAFCLCEVWSVAIDIDFSQFNTIDIFFYMELLNYKC